MQADATAVLLAAGRGRRMGGSCKALLPLAGEPMLAHSLRVLRRAPSVAAIVLVMQDEDVRELEQRWGLDIVELGVQRVVPGGAERWLSSRHGCEASDARLPYLLVHDAARPAIGIELVEAVLQGARAHGAALAAEPLADTLKRADARGCVLETVPRAGLWRAQTPQAFRRERLLAAFAAWDGAQRGLPTDEASLVEALGDRPLLIPSSADNLKVTTPPDLELAGMILKQRQYGSAP